MNRALEQLRREEMPRRSTSFTSTRARAQREAEAAHRRHLRQVAAAEKASRQRYASDRAAEVERKNDALADRIDDLRTLMDYVLSIRDPLTFDNVRLRKTPQRYLPPAHLSVQTPMPKPPGFLGKLFGGTARYEEELRSREAKEADRREEL